MLTDVKGLYSSFFTDLNEKFCMEKQLEFHLKSFEKLIIIAVREVKKGSMFRLSALLVFCDS